MSVSTVHCVQFGTMLLSIRDFRENRRGMDRALLVQVS